MAVDRYRRQVDRVQGRSSRSGSMTAERTTSASIWTYSKASSSRCASGISAGQFLVTARFTPICSRPG